MLPFELHSLHSRWPSDSVLPSTCHLLLVSREQSRRQEQLSLEYQRHQYSVTFQHSKVVLAEIIIMTIENLGCKKLRQQLSLDLPISLMVASSLHVE